MSSVGRTGAGAVVAALITLSCTSESPGLHQGVPAETAVRASAAVVPIALADTLPVAMVTLADAGFRCTGPAMGDVGGLANVRVVRCTGGHGSVALLAAAHDDARVAYGEFTAAASAVAPPYDRAATVAVLSWAARPMVVLAEGSRDRDALFKYVVGHGLDMQPHRADLFGGLTVQITPPELPRDGWVVTVSASRTAVFRGDTAVR